VEVRFAGAAPVRQRRRAAAVSDVKRDGPTLRGVVSGSFQPFLEALHRFAVITLTSMPAPPSTKERPA
jgi:hypothetical protein